jgi:hypothetical protein
MPSVISLWKRTKSYQSPFRVVRSYAMRTRHPFAYVRRRVLASQQVAQMSPEERARLDILERDGCAPAGADQDNALLEQVCAELRDRASKVQYEMTAAAKGKNFWERLLTDEDRMSTSPFVRLALQPKVLSMASGYLGEVPYLASIGVYLSHGTLNDKWQESQLWHCDYDDRKMVKLFVYCSEVKDEKDGAFTFIPKGISRRIRNRFFPGRISDEEMVKQGGTQHARDIRGPANTTFYIDTRGCYHLGSRVAVGHERLAYIISYVTHASLQPFDNGIKITGPLNETEKLVLRC